MLAVLCRHFLDFRGRTKSQQTFMCSTETMWREKLFVLTYMITKQKISTESYKGVRDFYPEDMFVQNHIFSVWKKVVESFGYSEYAASLLEPAELYAAKSGEEIVNEQTYTFEDRGGR